MAQVRAKPIKWDLLLQEQRALQTMYSNLRSKDSGKKAIGMEMAGQIAFDRGQSDTYNQRELFAPNTVNSNELNSAFPTNQPPPGETG